jgi:transposase
MAKFIMVGCDLHDKSMLLKIAVDQGKPSMRVWGTDSSARRMMVVDLRRRAAVVGAARIVFAYEASGFGFRLHDQLVATGIESFVLAPTRIERSTKHRKRKTDERDAQVLLDKLRSHFFAGVELPSVWVPDLQTRDDREVVRLRLALAEDAAAVKARIRWLLKRNGVEGAPGKAWTMVYTRWITHEVPATLPGGSAAALASGLRTLEWLESEMRRLDNQVHALSQTPRYSSVAASLRDYSGVGPLTAMVFLTELGDLRRFSNRRQVGSYLGLVPSSYETGQGDDHKGHITHQGASRIRKVLCQAVWCRLRTVPQERQAYDRIVERNPRHKKIAVVAQMRRLAIRLWYEGRAAQEALAAQAVRV